ncbi:uncharacterized protein LOC110049544 [Orbicella faveolata]|uniref:uncharacterized protein LOC110049544 n=1 Tax=Orbicella faveolata TaxID=48498 RepID=UPI0009E36AD9|nr:uncharacterized protein LOC110049544 [Orbicella faveolata]
MEVLRQEPYMHMGEKIPDRWFQFEKVIEALIAQQIYHRHLKQLQSYAKKHCFIEDADEFDGMISFYHGLGMIIKHRSTVVLKAQWLIDLLKQLITIPHSNKMDPVHYNYWWELEENGILCMELVDDVFSKFIQQGIIKDDILDMMEQFGLIAKFSPSPSDVKYFVPAQLKTPPKDLCQMAPSHADPCPLYIHFVHGFVPHGLCTLITLKMPSDERNRASNATSREYLSNTSISKPFSHGYHEGEIYLEESLPHYLSTYLLLFLPNDLQCLHKLRDHDEK